MWHCPVGQPVWHYASCSVGLLPGGCQHHDMMWQLSKLPCKSGNVMEYVEGFYCHICNTPHCESEMVQLSPLLGQDGAHHVALTMLVHSILMLSGVLCQIIGGNSTLQHTCHYKISTNPHTTGKMPTAPHTCHAVHTSHPAATQITLHALC
jgi:hypothetical protein